jgi:methylmalonyl-CoA/ethylmalonyl-CoA epimerase
MLEEISEDLELSHTQGNGERLHHVGIVVPSIAGAVEGLSLGLQMHWNGKVFYDPVQTVRVAFLQHNSPGMPMIELVEPASPQSRVARFIKQGGGLHHLCYEVDSLSVQLKNILSAGAILILESSPAVAFDGREIAWVYTREGLLLEYLRRAEIDVDRGGPIGPDQ